MEPDQTSPIYPELRGLLVKTLGPGPLLRSALSDIDGISEAYIYGSWAELGRPINVTVRSPSEWEEADGGFERAVRSRPKDLPDMTVLEDLLAQGLVEAAEVDLAVA